MKEIKDEINIIDKSSDNNAEKDSFSYRKICLIISIVCVVIASLVRVFTPGWTWFLFFGIIQIHSALFIFSNYEVALFAKKSIILKILFFISCISYLGFYVLLSNGGDYNNYALFGLVNGWGATEMTDSIAGHSLNISIISSLIELIIYKIKKG